MIGHRKFAWKVENLPPTEWFDLDREEIDMEFDGETQQNTPIFDDDFDDDEDDEEEIACPKCGSEIVSFVEDVQDDTGIVGQQYRCNFCKNQFNIYDED